jgi:ABC-type branched-subunit amino acid transport system ATPase component
MENTPVLEIRGIKKAFGGLDVLRGVDLTIGRGEIYGIIGPNGAGKSTLFDIISGYQKADGGEIIFEGRDITGRQPHLLAREGITRTFQLTRIFRNLTVAENLLVFATAGRKDRERAIELLDFVHLIGLADKEASMLSYGQSKLLEFAQVLMHQPRVLMVDEPFAGINPGLIDEMSAHLKTLKNQGITVVLIEHNLPMVAKLCDRVAVIGGGTVELEGVPDEVVNNERVKEVFLGG